MNDVRNPRPTRTLTRMAREAAVVRAEERAAADPISRKKKVKPAAGAQ